MSLKLIFSECLFPKHSRAPAHSQEIGGSGPAPSCSVSLRYTGVLSLRLKSTAEASFARRCLLTASHHSLSHRRQTGMEEPKKSIVCCLFSQSLERRSHITWSLLAMKEDGGPSWPCSPEGMWLITQQPYAAALVPVSPELQ